jgi:raffinose/stachyose/melibiose transport system permease protein
MSEKPISLPGSGGNLDKVKNRVLEIFMILLAILFFVPVVFVLVTAFRPEQEIDTYPMIFDAMAQGQAVNFTLSNFADAWEGLDFLLVFINTFTITVFSVAGVVLISSMAAYIMVRTRFTKVGWFLFGFFTFAMLIPFQVLMVPLAQTAKEWNLLGLGDLTTDGSLTKFLSSFGIIPMYWGLLTPMAIFMYHGFVKGVPMSLEESAHIDGAGQFRTFFQVVFPMMVPITATIIILDVLWVWNDFLLPLIILGPGSTIQLAMNELVGAFGSKMGPFAAALVLSSLPMMLLYLFLQRYIIKGIAAGAVKG